MGHPSTVLTILLTQDTTVPWKAHHQFVGSQDLKDQERLASTLILVHYQVRRQTTLSA